MYTSEQTVRLCTSWKMLSARKVKDKYGLRLHLHFDSFWFSTVKSVLDVAQDNFMHFHPACTAGAQPNSFSCSPLHKLLPAHVLIAPGAFTSFLVNPDILFLFLFSQVKNALRTNYRKLKEMLICLVGGWSVSLLENMTIFKIDKNLRNYDSYVYCQHIVSII